MTSAAPPPRSPPASPASLASHIDATAAGIIVKYLSSKRLFFKSPDYYLKQIQNVLTESLIQARSEGQKGTAREEKEEPSAAVGQVGKFILHQAKLNDGYYGRGRLRIHDTGGRVQRNGGKGPGKGGSRTRNEGKGPGKGGSRTGNGKGCQDQDGIGDRTTGDQMIATYSHGF